MMSRSVMFDLAFRQVTMPPRSSHDPDFDPDMNFSAKGGVPGLGAACLAGPACRPAGIIVAVVVVVEARRLAKQGRCRCNDRLQCALCCCIWEQCHHASQSCTAGHQESSVDCEGEEEKRGEGGSGVEGSWRDGAKVSNIKMPRNRQRLTGTHSNSSTYSLKTARIQHTFEGTVLVKTFEGFRARRERTARS